MMSNVTQLLEAAQAGDRHAAAELLPLVYEELRKLAAARMAREDAGHTLDATALVHEAYLRLVGEPRDRTDEPSDRTGEPSDVSRRVLFEGRGHFFAAAAEAMRRILIDHARQKLTSKHGGNWRRVDLQHTHQLIQSPEALVDLDDVLTRFAVIEPAKAKLVELRFFCGMTVAEAAATLGVSAATTARWWEFARLWLYAEMTKDKNPEKP